MGDSVAARTTTPTRLVSLDAYRGFIMLAMASGGFALTRVSQNFPDSPVWRFLGYEFDHVPWTGCSFWDLIQPSFMFMVGVAIPYSHASRVARGNSSAQIAGHVVLRALLLIVLGVFLMSNGCERTDFNFVNVLTQIGLGYAFVYLLRGRGFWLQLLAVVAILVGTWYLFYQHPLPPPDFDPRSVGVEPGVEWFTGLFAHWNKNANFASDLDHWFLGLFPYSDSYPYNKGGYATLNFVPSMATMLFGLMAGELLQSPRRPRRKLFYLLLAAAVCLALGWRLSETVCPSAKRIWTPSWTVFSAGWTVLFLAAFYAVLDLLGYRRWSFPLVVVGMNSITMYCMAQLLKPWIRQTIRTHFGQDIFEGTYGPIVASASILAVLWLVCFWMYRQRFFVRI
jgi:predicted acyltransferase